MNARAIAPALLVCLCSCASDAPAAPEVPRGEAQVVIHVAGDGFVRVGERRVPLETIVLELRQRARKMTADERERFVAEIRADPQPEGSEAQRIALRNKNRLIDEINVMDLGVVRL